MGGESMRERERGGGERRTRLNGTRQFSFALEHRFGRVTRVIALSPARRELYILG
jgi:hypothetical protein